MTGATDGAWSGFRVTARLRLTLSYVLFLLAAGAVSAVCLYAVMRFVPDYPLTAANPRDADLPVASRGEILDAVVQASAVSLVVLALLGSVGGWWLAGRVLRPLAELNAAARAAADGDLARRVGSPGRRRDEFTDLADTFDSMLDRLERDLHGQRRFAANASHELRTPLAVMQAMLDVARADPDDVDVPELLDRLHTTNRRAVELVTALLELAALDRGPLVRTPVVLDVVVEDVIDDVQAEARQHGVEVRADLEPVTVPGDEALLGRLVDNLLRNAVRHNLPTGGWVDVRVVAERRGPVRDVVTLLVSNSGPDVDARALAVAQEPFARDAAPQWRGQESGERSGSTAGRPGLTASHGLGLPLAARIVEAHGGTLRLAPRPGGGVVAAVSLPAHVSQG
ncbi:sensor histidine kinase [Oerskovia flava]|uniref:sensor histidine kinase n=1 Tax=Oerskovia flava TaxID=2986422 RepID=UPI00223EEC29|nr:HAMP domain-containing sensor histidine kinase [Oerskovia sp. JB1-3-2]